MISFLSPANFSLRFLPGLLSALSMTAGLHAANPDLRFFLRSNEITFPPTSNRAAALADLNHDGKADLVRGINGSQVAVALGTGTGTFGSATSFATGNTTLHVKIARINGDAHPDIIAGNFNDATVSVLLGDGNGGFLPQQVTDVGLRVMSMEIVDFNQDGKADIIATGYMNHATQGLVTTLVGNGDGTFSQKNTFNASVRTAFTMTHSVSVADLNGDSLPDFVVSAPYNGGTVISFLNLGNGSFSRHREMQMPGPPGRTALADFNGDGKTDLAVLLVADPLFGNLPPGQNIGVIMGNGDGTFGSLFSAGTIYGVNGVAIHGAGPANDTFVGRFSSLTATDMDGDGRLDLVFSAESTVMLADYAVILRGQANGGFNFGTRKQVDTDNQWLSVADLDNDGSPDIVSTLGRSTAELLLSHVIPPQITSAASAAVRVFLPISFSVTATGTPAPAINVTGNLPAGMNFNSSQGLLFGNPAPGTVGRYPLVFTASNEFGQTETQAFELVVTGGAVSPAITSTNAATFHIGLNGLFNITTTGDPAPRIQVSGTLPPGISSGFRDIRGVAAAGSEGTYPLSITARNDYGETVTQPFTLYVVQDDLMVTTTTDEDNGSPDPSLGTGRSLREAINRANSFTGPQTITFSPALAGQTLLVSRSDNGSAFTVWQNLTIRGLQGDEGITLDGGGGAFRMFLNNNNLTLTDLTITGCHGDVGSGVFNGNMLTVERCTFHNNRSERSGGAIFNSWGETARIINCTVTNNYGFLGGAVDSQGYAQIVNTTISGNTTSAISNHPAGLVSSGVNNSVTLTNSIVVNNTRASNGNPSDLGGRVLNAASSHNLVGTGGSGSLSNGVNGNITGVIEPGLGEFADNGGPTMTFALLDGSPAADAGTTSGAAATDQRGRPRVRFTAVDIGAYERGPESFGAIVNSGDADWYLGPVAMGSELRVYRQQQGQPAIWIDGGLGAEISKSVTGTVLVRRADGRVKARAGSATGAGSAWQSMEHVIAADGSTWFLLNEGSSEDHAVYRWAESSGPVLGHASGVRLYLRENGGVILRNAAGNYYERIGSAAGLGSVWQVLAPSLVVTTLSDEDDGVSVPELGSGTSLREALAYANAKAGPDTITFAPALGGRTITLSAGWNDANDTAALRAATEVTIQGPATGLGVTIAMASGVQKRHLFVEGSGTLTLSHLTFTNGHATDFGGSIWSYGSLTVRACTFTGNFAGSEGGAIQSWGGSPSLRIENSTFSGNTSGNFASAIGAGSLQVTFRHLTITGNTGPNGTLWLYETVATMQNTILAGNSSDGVQTFGTGAFSTQSTNNILGTGGSGGLTNGVNGNRIGVVAANLKLGALENNGGVTQTVALLPGSPAINTGVALAGITTDQRGIIRGAATGGLRGRYYSVPSGLSPALLAPLSNLEALAPDAVVATPRVDFGLGTESAPGNGSVLDRDGSPGNLFGGLGVNVGSDNSAALWDGFITVPATADYRFTTRSDDGSVLYIDGQLVVSNNAFQAPTNISGQVSLSAGLHSIRIGYYEGGGGATMQVSWEQLNGTAPFARQIIPSGVLSMPAAFGSVPDIGAFEFEAVPATSPVITPASGSYESSVTVSMSTVATGATIRYTVDGSAPTASTGAIYSIPFLLSNSATVRAIATGGDWLDSAVANANYTVLTPLQMWRALQGLATDGSQDVANPSGDGITNLLKFAFNMAPIAGDLARPNVGVLPVDGTAGLPRTFLDAQGRLVVEFVRRKASTNPGITYVLQTGDDLTNFTPLDISGASVASIDTVWERVTATDPTITPMRFGRVRITLP